MFQWSFRWVSSVFNPTSHGVSDSVAPIGGPQIEDDIKNEHDLKNENDHKNEEMLYSNMGSEMTPSLIS